MKANKFIVSVLFVAVIVLLWSVFSGVNRGGVAVALYIAMIFGGLFLSPFWIPFWAPKLFGPIWVAALTVAALIIRPWAKSEKLASRVIKVFLLGYALVFVGIVLFLAFDRNGQGFGACPDLSGQYVYQGEDNKSIWELKQEKCTSLEVTDSVLPNDKLVLKLDGTFTKTRSGLLGSVGECLAADCIVSARFVGNVLEVSWYLGKDFPKGKQIMKYSLNTDGQLMMTGFERPGERLVSNPVRAK